MPNYTIEDLIDPFSIYLEVNKNYSKATVESYNSTIIRMSTWLKEIRREILYLDQVTSNDLQLFLGTLRHPKTIELRSGSLKPHPKANKLFNATTRARIISAIKAFFKWAVKQQYLKYDVAQSIDSPKLETRIPKSLTLEDAIKMERAAAQRKIAERDYLITVIFLLLGLRVSELVSIDLIHIDEYEGTISIIGKGDKERKLMLTPKIVRALDAYRPVRQDILNRRNRIDQPALFVSEKRGDRLTRRGVELIIEEIALVSGAKAGAGFKVSPHKLRHTCATVLYNEGKDADLLAIAELLGHKDPNTTKIYTTVNKEKMRAMVTSNPLENM
ncbi:tyrosine-type recombinase/integrase [Paenibacillus periandrae]|uniref:tyrosine-type recombinase/integrase n=1 Tax=Paenibacillus periandrae TaxID=1761741 RepID=UPI001F09C8BF|nr:tyrosine-type recombinase/integrase [Paenibacillus periandrae]